MMGPRGLVLKSFSRKALVDKVLGRENNGYSAIHFLLFPPNKNSNNSSSESTTTFTLSHSQSKHQNFSKALLSQGPGCQASCWGRIAQSRASVQSTISRVHKDCRNMELQSLYDWPHWDIHRGTDNKQGNTSSHRGGYWERS
ncbi:hypothetical protein HYC85_022026 [Camellia sinensis]|uniref:Uncharacterized protein n=1 Tax=Camellia sinensis TaxID=4442 RepID=A0A7J7GJ70_CAMSI|nr:hypothetical protein HYC85_022026 [Camellia sinensis]